MPRFSDEQKKAASKNKLRIERLAAATVPAAGAAVLIPGFGPLVSVGVGVIGFAIFWRAGRQERIIIDPARDDFSLPTEPEPPRFDTAVFGDSRLAGAVADFVRVTDELAALFEAVVVAVERASGAEQAGDHSMMEARTVEALTFAEQASAQLFWSSDYARAIAEALSDFAEFQLPTLPADLPVPLGQVLSEEIVEQAERIGVPRDFLYSAEIKTLPDAPIRDLIEVLGDTAEADAEYAGTIRDAISAETFIEGVEGLEGMGREPA